MEITECNIQDIISEESIRQITEEINKHIIDSLFGIDINSENYKKYRDKFDIIIMGKKQCLIMLDHLSKDVLTKK